MSKFDAQHTDRENSKPAPKSVARDEALRSSSRGSLQNIAREDTRQSVTSGSAITSQRIK